MKRILPFVYVLILALVIVAIASQTEQGVVIRRRIQKRVQERLEADLPADLRGDLGDLMVPPKAEAEPAEV